MNRTNFLQDFQQRVLELLRASPAADVERNLKALVTQTFNKLEVVPREEFEIQRELLRDLSARVAVLESDQSNSGAAASTPLGARTRSEADASAMPLAADTTGSLNPYRGFTDTSQ